MKNPDEVASVSDYIARVVDVSKQWDSPSQCSTVWFRGIPHLDYKLQPRLYRDCEGSPSDQEGNIRLEFFNRALPYMSAMYDRKEWDWYFLMQHYRVPTRLLDWTESALVALYFALYSRRSDQASPPAVWMLNPHELNAIAMGKRSILVPGEFAEFGMYLPVPRNAPITGKLPIAICPQHADPRMAAQYSRFTLHGNLGTPLEDMPQFRGLLKTRYLVRISFLTSEYDSVDRLKRELTLLGMRNSTVLPGLEGLALDICEDYAPG